MRLDELIKYYPRLFHMAETGSWPSIRERGLLSTSALLDLFEIKGERHYKIESQWRPRSIEIQHPFHGRAVIRDQIPMPEKALRQCLRRMCPQEWYELINSKTFFWVTEHRLKVFLNAKTYRHTPHLVITVDTSELVRRYLGSMTLTALNTGSTYNRTARGRDSFIELEDFPFASRFKTKGKDAVVELAVEYSVPDIVDFTISVAEWQGDDLLKVIWEA